MDELAAVVDAVVATLEGRSIPYLVTGSLASSVHGEFRATNDIDIVVAMSPAEVAAVVESLSSEFVGDPAAARAAFTAGASTNLIHRHTFLKVDLFPSRGPFEEEALRRAEPTRLPGTTRTVRVATREDIILAKLRWYRLGGEQSGVQWRDLTRLAAINHDVLDLDYLRRWAHALSVHDLLERLLARPL